MTILETSFLLYDTSIPQQQTPRSHLSHLNLSSTTGPYCPTAESEYCYRPGALVNARQQKRGIDLSVETMSIDLLMQNAQLQSWTSLCDVRYTTDGQRYDLQRIFMGSLPVAAKRKNAGFCLPSCI